MTSFISAFIVLALVLAGLVIGPDQLNISLRFYDSILHFLGGIGIGFFLYGLASSFSFPSPRKWMRVMGGVLIIGIIWELFEVYYDIPGYPLWTTLYYIDTAKDLALDVIGGSLTLLISCRHTRE